MKIQFDYPFESSIRHYLNTANITINHVDYQKDVTFQLEIEKNQIPLLRQQARNLCKGQVLINTDTNLNNHFL
ncbi:MAG: DUF1949 domain-containing protein [gamma proteobacterium symbiont of Lucinoma myriamae]|nr:DUF1949 domain-containing protein [gamma proteobacterium symbiont of Lucinoma myriamae]